MSGGVDSAVAAARAADAGHDVTGVHLALSRNPQTHRSGARGCCTLEDARDARRAADVIGIPFYVWDMAEQFHEDVVDDFVAEYAAGRTPNPCLRCNEKIKFAAVLDRAVALGFDAVVTGHHARLGADGLLRRSVDAAKDQSYVLAVLTREQLDRSIFPLGDSTKAQVRAEAAERGLAVAEKPDSHDICFIADGDTQGFLAARLGSATGDIVDASTGAVLGQHDGAHGYTIGQRKGLHLDRPAPDGRPRYVLSITPVTNTVVVGPAEALDVDVVHADRAVWTGPTVGGVRSSARCRCAPTARRRPLSISVGDDGALVAHARRAGPRDRRRAGARRLSAGPGRRHRARLGHHHASGQRRRGGCRGVRARREAPRVGVCERVSVGPGFGDRHRIAARYRHRRGDSECLRRAARPAIPAGAAGPGPGCGHGRPGRRSARGHAGRAVRGPVAHRLAPRPGRPAHP